MPSPSVAAALGRMDRKAGRPPRRPPTPPGEVYGIEQLAADLHADRCPVHGCESSTGSRNLMCRGHWRLVPSDLKAEVRETVRRVIAVSRRYDAATGAQQGRLASIWLEDEAAMREAQLRAVIVASERAGARAT